MLLLTACQESLEDRCEREAKEYTKKHCPALIAENIVMDEMTFEKATHQSRLVSDVYNELKRRYRIQKNGEILFRFPRLFFKVRKS